VVGGLGAKRRFGVVMMASRYKERCSGLRTPLGRPGWGYMGGIGLAARVGTDFEMVEVSDDVRFY